jgi:F-type H+-transporting ATPase subunit delta
VSIGATGLAGRYASALYALAVENKKIDAVHLDLTTLFGLVGEHCDLQNLIESPIISREVQQTAITEILEKAGADLLTIKFAGTLAQNGRLKILDRVIQAFLNEHARRRGEVSAEVVSALPLVGDRKAIIEKTVAQLAGSDKLSLSMSVDPSLIGGIVVRIGSRMIDTSIKTKLSRLETAMKGVA